MNRWAIPTSRSPQLGQGLHHLAGHQVDTPGPRPQGDPSLDPHRAIRPEGQPRGSPGCARRDRRAAAPPRRARAGARQREEEGVAAGGARRAAGRRSSGDRSAAPAAARGRRVEATARRRPSRLRSAPPVWCPARPARAHLEQRRPAGVDPRRQAARRRHLAQVAEQPEPGHVGGAAHARRERRGRRPRGWSGASTRRRRQARVVARARGGDGDPHPERLGQHQAGRPAGRRRWSGGGPGGRCRARRARTWAPGRRSCGRPAPGSRGRPRPGAAAHHLAEGGRIAVAREAATASAMSGVAPIA